MTGVQKAVMELWEEDPDHLIFLVKVLDKAILSISESVSYDSSLDTDMCPA